ncbi:MAG: NAD(+)/NADH kinase [Limnochordales bacterium]|nr:NAD(+)/NADH kinase [Limnochordales bacterium]
MKVGSNPITRVGIWPHPQKHEALRLARELILQLQARGVAVWLTEEGRARLTGVDVQGVCEPQDIGKQVELLVVLGGDGALLSAARAVARQEVPLLGVNVGHLGFLTELESGDVEGALERLLAGDFRLDSRLMLHSRVERQGKIVAEHLALNDVVITRTTFARMIRLRTFVGGEFVVEYMADGMIVATPTGSTAYSLSAGGPIVSPDVEAMVITAICPHTLAARSLVVPPREEIVIELAGRDEGMQLTVDGQEGVALRNTDRLLVEVAPYRTRLVRLHTRSFYTLLQSRLRRQPGEW